MPLNRDDQWLTHIPLLRRILAGGEPSSTYPPMPRSDDIFEYCAYWGPLYYLLNTILGWRNLSHGLGWWYSNGKSDHGDQSLAIMKQIWDTDRQIDFFAAWAWQEGRYDFTLENAAHTSAFRNEDWWRDLARGTRERRPCAAAAGSRSILARRCLRQESWLAGHLPPESCDRELVCGQAFGAHGGTMTRLRIRLPAQPRNAPLSMFR